MKLDDRDIVCETDYSPLSNAELVTQIERYAAITRAAPLIEFDLERITGPARALLARVEAAEAEAARIEKARLYYQERTAAVTAALDVERANNKAAWQRVAELEAQLAAQQWRPVTEKPEKPGWYVVYDSDGHVFYNAEIFPYRVARWTGKWDSAFNGLVDYWRPLPPAPQETTQ
jgi:hypothetical protein